MADTNPGSRFDIDFRQRRPGHDLEHTEDRRYGRPPRAEGYHWCGCLAWLSGYAFNDSLDYRYRNYDNGERRDDKALRWNGAVSRTMRSRDIAELTGSWTHSLLDGKASASLAAFGGREFATHDRPDGDSDFVGLSPSLHFALTEHLGGFVFASWQHDRYNDERFNVGPSDEILGTGTRNDDLPRGWRRPDVEVQGQLVVQSGNPLRS